MTRAADALPDRDDYLQELGDTIRQARKQCGFSRKALASRSGISERYLAQLEGGTGNPSVTVLRLIADSTSTPVWQLLPELSGDPELLQVVSRLQRLSEAEKTEFCRFAAHWMQRSHSADRQQRFALIGLRGAGKSTLARTLSGELGIPCIELTREIERESGLGIQEIFSLYGDGGYRDLETSCLRSVLNNHSRVILAVAGGITTNPQTYDTLLGGFYTVWLQASPREHMQRVLDQGDRRPVSGIRGAMDALQGILRDRKSAYARAQFSLDTSGKTVAQSTAELADIVRPLIGGES